MTRSDRLERIAKLRRLADNNSNEHEAASARRKADELEAELEPEPTFVRYSRPFPYQHNLRRSFVLTSNDIAVLNEWQSIADRWRRTADYIQREVDNARDMRNMKGFDPMPAFSFNAGGIDPRYGSGGGLPVGKHPVTITASSLKTTKDGTGGMIVFTVTAFDGPAKGSSMDDNLNVHNKSAQAVEIANKQLAAYCAVCGVGGFNATEELHNKPFVVEVAQQKGNPQYVEIVGLFDMNGNDPSHAQAPQAGGNAGGGNAGGGFSAPPTDQGQGQGGGNAGGFGGGGAGNGAFGGGQGGQNGGGQAGGGTAWSGGGGGQNGGGAAGGGTAGGPWGGGAAGGGATGGGGSSPAWGQGNG